MLGQIYSFPESASLMEIERERMLRTDAQAAGSDIFPITEEMGEDILWEIRDNVQGLSYTREGEEAYPNRNETGSKRFATMPAKFGERIPMSASKINRARKVGTFGEPIDISATLNEYMQEIVDRQVNTMEYIRWRMACLGDVKLPKKDGTTITVARFTPTTVNGSTAWNDRANAVPLKDLQNLRNTYAGFGFDFGGGAVAYGNAVTIDNFIMNVNANDIGRQRLNLGQTITTIDQINKLILNGMGLPTFKTVDDGYLDGGVFNRFIPDGYLVIVGRHWSRGLNAGEFVMTSNEALLGQPGIFANTGRSPEAPYLPFAEQGWNGGPRVNYGRQIVVLKTY